jgi:8-oxo-dGTP diphosphatase
MSRARQTIRIVAAVVVNDRGETLLVRKQGTAAFMQPGGKRSPGETDLDTLARELREELCCEARLVDANHLGRFRALAAHEPGAVVEADLYWVRLDEAPVPGAEIAELLWLDPCAAERPPLAPLTEFQVLPRLNRGASPPPADRVLFVCKGNWFRSQMAAAIYNKLTGSEHADSAGTYAGAPDEPEGQLLADLFPTTHFFEAMEKRGMYVRANTTRRLRREMLSDYDIVVAMAEEPFVPDFLRDHDKVVWWAVENPRVVDEAKAGEIHDLLDGQVRELIVGRARPIS